MRTAHEILGVEKNATFEEIKSAYRKMALEIHPDQNPNDPEAAEKFRELNEAYEQLCSTEDVPDVPEPPPPPWAKNATRNCKHCAGTGLAMQPGSPLRSVCGECGGSGKVITNRVLKRKPAHVKAWDAETAWRRQQGR